MKPLITSIAIGILATLGTTHQASAGHQHRHGQSSHIYISGYLPCGTPIFTERYLAGYNRCGSPIWRYRNVSPPRHYRSAPRRRVSSCQSQWRRY